MTSQNTLDQVETLLGRLGKKYNAQPIIKELHDDMLSPFKQISEEKLVIQNLNNQQIWQQVNRHLNEVMPQWGRFLERVDKQLKRQKEKKVPVQQGEEQGENGYEVEEEEMPQDEQLREEQVGQEEEAGQDEDADGKMLEMEDQQDVGLYGQQLDDEDDQGQGQSKYQLSQDDQFNNNMRDEQQIEADNLEDENFEYFRQVQMEKGEQDEGNEDESQPEKKQDVEPTDEISKFQKRLLDKKDWRLKGQVTSKDRPVDSLIDTSLQFKVGIKPSTDVDEQYNTQIEGIIKQRILDQMYDDRARYEFNPSFKEHFTALPEVSTQKNKQSLGEIYQQDFKNSLGLKESKQQKLKNQIMQMFKELNYKLDCLTNFNFMPKPVIKEATITNDQYILKEEKIPITVAKDKQGVPENLRRELKSEKERDHNDRQTTRLRNKRIQRQRKKQRDAKKANRIIEYGGQTKFEAEALKKIKRNKQISKKIKYSQSGQFFKALQENTANKIKSKPNPNINKMKM